MKNKHIKQQLVPSAPKPLITVLEEAGLLDDEFVELDLKALQDQVLIPKGNCIDLLSWKAEKEQKTT